MNHSRLQYLLTQYARRDIQEKELRELLTLIEVGDAEDIDKELDALIAKHVDIDHKPEKFNRDDTLQKIWSRLADKQLEDRPIRHIKRRKPVIWWAAAMVGALMLFGVWFMQYQSENIHREPIAMEHDILLPDDAQVSLRLTDGTEYNLMEMDQVALREKGIEIVDDETGGIVFVAKQKNDDSGLQTFTNPKGNTAKLRLADGSTVLLNSGSSITFPSSFEASERHVEITGELYFEVASDRTKPFVVSTGNTAVKVLGTAFNITADNGNEVQAALVEGSVEVSSHQNITKLVPGTQALVNQQGDIQVSKAQLRDVLAWKNGYFSFDDYNIDQVMAQLQRWYDIEELSIEGRTDDLFVASITRTRKLSEVLEQLEKISNYKFKIEGRRVTVMK